MSGRGGRSGNGGRESKRKAAAKSAAVKAGTAKRKATKSKAALSAAELQTRRCALCVLADLAEILLPHVERAIEAGEFVPTKTAEDWEGVAKNLEPIQKALANVRAAYERAAHERGAK